MTCPDFEKKVYLYLSGELDASEKNEFESHLKECLTCEKEFKDIQQTWLAMEHLPENKPAPEIRQTILREAQKAVVKPSRFSGLSTWIDTWIIPRKWLWGLSTAAVAVTLVLFIIQPFGRKEQDQLVQADILSWDDDFFSQAELINSEIDRIESGQFMTTYTFMEEDLIGFEETLSPMSEDLNWIREQVENLMRTIYGI